MILSTRYTITLPVLDNEGEPVPAAHAHCKATLRRKFDGFTERQLAGEWQGMVDRSVQYIVDVPSDPEVTARAYGVLHSLCQRLRRRARQDCIYLTRQTLEVELVD